MLEIERKFLVRGTDWGPVLSSRPMQQGYVFVADDRSLRVRRAGDAYTLTLKVSAEGIGRHEIELPVDPEEGQLILDRLCTGETVRKTRHIVEHAGKTWEIDVFEGANAGLIVAEIELGAEDERFALPPWIGPEVTGQTRMLNAALSQRPFRDWGLSYDALLAECEAAAG
jgi:adenylate cyclase